MRGSEEPHTQYEIDVWPCNRRAAMVFEHCQLGYVGGMTAMCIGLSATEITAAMDGMRIAPHRRRSVLRDVTCMGKAAADWINEQNRKATG